VGPPGLAVSPTRDWTPRFLSAEDYPEAAWRPLWRLLDVALSLSRSSPNCSRRCPAPRSLPPVAELPFNRQVGVAEADTGIQGPGTGAGRSPAAASSATLLAERKPARQRADAARGRDGL